MTAVYIIAAIIIFGVLIAVHELGHFIAAKSLGVKVNEFAIGMGPAFFKRQKGETLYTLRAFPVGGFCAMEGEDEDSPDPRSFNSKAAWRRLIILAGGALMNLLLGFVIIVALYSQHGAFVTTTVESFMPGNALEEQGLAAGDRIVKIDGNRIYNNSDISLFISRSDTVFYDLEVKRGGETVQLDNFKLERQEFQVNGETKLLFGMNFAIRERSLLAVLEYSWNEARDLVRLVWLGLTDLITGRAGIAEMSGPVGIVSMITEVGEQSSGPGAAVLNILYFGAFIAINLAVMNLLPIPALDGGRIFALIITAGIEKIRRKKVDPKYEGYIHSAGLVLLLALMVFVTFNDILKIFKG